MDIAKRHENIILYRPYTESNYPKYDTYNAINVDKVSEIPYDYDGIMGVPISFLNRYNPEQFEIIGEANHGSDNEYDYAKPAINGKDVYPRILIKRKEQNL